MDAPKFRTKCFCTALKGSRNKCSTAFLNTFVSGGANLIFGFSVALSARSNPTFSEIAQEFLVAVGLEQVVVSLTIATPAAAGIVWARVIRIEFPEKSSEGRSLSKLNEI